MNIYTTLYMLTLLDSLVKPNTSILDRYFPLVQTFPTETIFFDKVTKKRRKAPFVSPLVEGQVMESLGHTTDSFNPAYLKPKTPLDPNRPLKRAAGEPFGSNLTPADREALCLAIELREHMEMIEYTLESMAVEILRTGKVTVSGEKYQTQVVDFGRDPALTTALSGDYRWGQSKAAPLDNLQTWSALTLKKSSAATRDVIMDIDAWNAFRKDPEVKAELALYRGNSTMVQDAIFENGLVFMGTIQGYNIFVYNGLTEGDLPLLVSGEVILASPTDLMGVRAFGAIKDRKAGYMALPYFPKVIEVDDPSSLILLTQSAPLLVPERANASMCVSVLG